MHIECIKVVSRLHALVDLSAKTDVLNLRSRVLVDLSAQKYVLNMHLLTFLHYLHSEVIKCTNPYNLVILFYRVVKVK